MKKFWSDSEREVLRWMYADHSTKEVAKLLRRSVGKVYQQAAKLGLKKSAEYLASPAACRLRRGDKVGWAHRFPPGHEPMNKGLHRPGWGPGRMKQMQFKKGNRPHTWRPVGSTRTCKDGYLERKISDTGCVRRDWVGVHILVWRERVGPVPSGHAVCFRDGNKGNIVIENLELVSRAELMRRNTIHRLPQELKTVIRLGAKLNRKIRERDEKYA